MDLSLAPKRSTHASIPYVCLLNALANQQTAFGQLDDAARSLRRALALNPLSPAALYNLGGVYMGMNDYAEAEHALAQALELSPGISVVHAFRAIAAFQQNRVDEAVKIAEAEPDPLWRNYALAIVHWGRGDRARADAALQSLVRDSGDLAATQIADAYARLVPELFSIDHPNEEFYRTMRERALLHMAELTTGEAEVVIERIVVRGRPRQEIVAVAADWGADLVVLARHGSGGLRNAFMGSTSEAVLRHAPCPVLVLPPPTPEPA